jgi:cystathionine beta-synthase
VQFRESVIDLIGQTPLVRLGRMSEGLAPLILAKLESANPGGSAKDRIALRMIEAAEQAGQLRAGGTIVEPTSGNTGVGLALVAQRKGYPCVFTCPDKVSPDKIAVLRAYGAEVVICPAAVPPDHPESYRSVAQRIAEQTPGAYRPDQYSNPGNPESHYYGTGPEIWAQTEGRVTVLVAGVGTGGTISGTGRYLKEASNGSVSVIGADPDGSIYTGGCGRPYFVEGVGQPTYPQSFDPSVPDEILAVTDEDSIATTRRLAREEGILTGGSGGMVVAAALRYARSCGPDDVMVIVVPDSGRGYLSKIFNDDWVFQHGFEDPQGTGPRVGDLLEHGLIVVDPAESLRVAAKAMHASGLTHLPVSSARAPVRLAEILGTLTEESLARRAIHGRIGDDDAVADHMGPPLPIVGRGQYVRDIIDTIRPGGAALVLDQGLPCGVIGWREIAAVVSA